MALITVKYDTTKGRIVADTLGGSGGTLTDEYFTATASQTDFVFTAGLTDSDEIDVWVDGRAKREGASHDFTRDSGTDKIVFNSGLNADSIVKVRVVTGGSIPFGTQSFDATNGQTDFTLGTINATQTLDVWVSGRQMREGGSNDFTRDTGTMKIIFNNALSGGEWVQVRTYDN